MISAGGSTCELLPAGFPSPLVLASPDGARLTLPGDLPALFGGLSLGRAIPALVLAGAGIETTRDLLRLDPQSLRYCPGVGEARAQAITRHLLDVYGLDWPPKTSTSLRSQLTREAFDLALEAA